MRLPVYTATKLGQFKHLIFIVSNVALLVKAKVFIYRFFSPIESEFIGTAQGLNTFTNWIMNYKSTVKNLNR